MENEEKILGLLENISARLGNVESELKGLKTQTKENTEMIKAVKYAAEEIDAKVTALSFDVAKISGEIVSIKDDFANVESVTVNNWKNIIELKKQNS